MPQTSKLQSPPNSRFRRSQWSASILAMIVSADFIDYHDATVSLATCRRQHQTCVSIALKHTDDHGVKRMRPMVLKSCHRLTRPLLRRLGSEHRRPVGRKKPSE